MADQRCRLVSATLPENALLLSGHVPRYGAVEPRVVVACCSPRPGPRPCPGPWAPTAAGSFGESVRSGLSGYDASISDFSPSPAERPLLRCFESESESESESPEAAGEPPPFRRALSVLWTWLCGPSAAAARPSPARCRPPPPSRRRSSPLGGRRLAPRPGRSPLSYPPIPAADDAPPPYGSMAYSSPTPMVAGPCRDVHAQVQAANESRLMRDTAAAVHQKRSELHGGRAWRQTHPYLRPAAYCGKDQRAAASCL